MNLEEHIRTVQDFPKPGIAFKDITPLLQNSKAFTYCISRLAEQYKHEDIDAIGAFDARGFLFGAPLALAMGKPFFPIRKAGKLPYQSIQQSYGLEYGTDTVEVHTDAVRPGQKVLLIDDLLATGGTMKAGCQLVEKLGGVVVGCQAVIELEGLGGREQLAGYKTASLLRYGL